MSGHESAISHHAQARDRHHNGPESTEGMLSDRLRIWEMRRYWQARTMLSSPSSTPQTPNPEQHGVGPPCSILSSILRCTISELDCDFATISLVDETSQLIIASAARPPLPLLQSSSDRFDLGSLCVSTMAVSRHDTVHERDRLDLDIETMNHPLVNGEQARYRSFAGIPLITSRKLKIGMLSIFSTTTADDGGIATRKQYLARTAEHVMMQLDLVIQSLEASRTSKFNEAVAALTHSREASTPGRQRPGQSMDNLPLSNEHFEFTGGSGSNIIYKHAAKLLLQTFDFDGVNFQTVNLQTESTRANVVRDEDESDLLAHEGKAGTYQIGLLQTKTVDKMLECWPAGEVFHRISQDEAHSFLVGSGTSPWTDHDELKMAVGKELVESLPYIQQLLFTPLWDSFHDRVVAISVAWVMDWRRVYTTTADLFPITTFCMAVMNLVRRKESQRTEQQKADFLGSISHEMRSPLHGTLANIELLLGSNIDDEQRDMLQNAAAGGQQLLDTIDKVLQFTHMSEEGQPDAAAREDGAGHLASDLPKHLQSIAAVEWTDFHQLTVESIKLVIEQARLLTRGTPTPLATPMSPGEGLTSFMSMKSGLYDAEFDIRPIIFDTQLSHSQIMGYPNAFRTVLLHIMSNAIKYTSEGCVRVTLTIEDGTNVDAPGAVVLKVADCGIGMSEAYRQNYLFAPFVQADQLQSGTGLGLAVAKRTVDAVNGQIFVESDEDAGTTVTVRLALLSPMSDDEQHVSSPAKNPSDAHQVCHIYVPKNNMSESRRTRYISMLQESLSNCARDILGLKFLPWHPGASPRVIAVLQEDAQALENEMEHTGGQTRKLLLCSSPDELQMSNGQTVATNGPLVLPSDVVSGLKKLLGKVENGQDFSLSNTSRTGHDDRLTDGGSSDAAYDQKETEQPINRETVSQHSAHIDNFLHVHEREPSHQKAKPNVLLVDDNLINLKVLGLYCKKCEIAKSTAVTGGQEAIQAFEEAASSDETAIDVVFMDLSMPAVSGFDATAAIRRLEARSPQHSDQRKVHIVALTGLVSTKDRVAAFDAGVDDYLTKPAKVADIRRLITSWTHGNAGSQTV